MERNIIHIYSDTEEDITTNAAETNNLEDNIAKELSEGDSGIQTRSRTKRRRSSHHMTLGERVEHLRRQRIILNESSTVDEDPSKNVIVLEGHSNGIRCCAWSPELRTLASGSRDATARIWVIPDGTGSSSSRNVPLCHVLKHDEYVTALDWNLEGTLLATGSSDGKARVWNKNGEPLYTRSLHNETILSLKWNRKGDRILTGSNDHTATVWDIEESSAMQFKFHSDSIIDVDWMDDYTFATCSADRMIYVCNVTKTRPIKSFSGHKGEVNCVKWDSSGKFLASCSADKTIKIWSMDQQKYVMELKGHAEGIETIKWSPIGPDMTNPNSPPILASASIDSTVKLWDFKTGECIYSLDDHSDAVVAIAFSPDGQYLATGSLDKSVRIWHLMELKTIFTYTASDAISGLSWNKEGDRVAIWCFDSQVYVLDPGR